MPMMMPRIKERNDYYFFVDLLFTTFGYFLGKFLICFMVKRWRFRVPILLLINAISTFIIIRVLALHSEMGTMELFEECSVTATLTLFGASGGIAILIKLYDDQNQHSENNIRRGLAL